MQRAELSADRPQALAPSWQSRRRGRRARHHRIRDDLSASVDVIDIRIRKAAFDLVRERLRLEARRKLTHVAAPISLLAYELGFEGPAYFAPFFKSRVGMPPSAIRHAGL